MIGVWKYETEETYGDDVSYEKGMAFLDGRGDIEDWGCGCAHAKEFVKMSRYVGIDGSGKWADKIVDLAEYTSNVDCIFMRHVLEHNYGWEHILQNAVDSFHERMVLIIFTPFSEKIRKITNSCTTTNRPVPDISFRKEDLTVYFSHLRYTEEHVRTRTQYGEEHLFYIKKS